MEKLKNKTKEEIMKRCYEISESVNWEANKLYNKTDLQLYEIRKYVKAYIEDVLKEPLTKEQIWFLIESKDKVLFNTYDDILKLMLEKKIISYEKIKDVDWISNNLRNSICKFCYDMQEKFNWIPKDVKEYVEKYNINFTSIVNLSKEYIDRILKWDDSKKGEHLENRLDNIYQRNREDLRKNPIGYAKVLTDVLNAEKEDDIIRIIEQSGKNFYSLKYYIPSFLMVYHDNSEVIKKKFFDKWKVYEDYFNEKKEIIKEHNLEKREEEKKERSIKRLAIAQQIINKYLDSEYDKIDDFCAYLNIGRRLFEQCINILKDYDEELYNKYVQRQESLQSNRFAVILTKVYRILKFLKEGINENGKIREFDLVDYYSCTNLTFEELLNITKGKLNASDYRLLRTFIARNQNDKKMSSFDISNLYNTKTVVGAKFDKKQNVIPGTGREITKEEKQNIINYLKTNHLPVTNKTYNIIYRRWLSGELVIETKKDKTK